MCLTCPGSTSYPHPDIAQRVPHGLLMIPDTVYPYTAGARVSSSGPQFGAKPAGFTGFGATQPAAGSFSFAAAQRGVNIEGVVNAAADLLVNLGLLTTGTVTFTLVHWSCPT